MRITQKILIYAVAVLLCICAVVTSRFSGTAAYAAADNAGIKFDKTNVLEDLQSSETGGKAFDVRNYPYDATGRMGLITFTEYCYSPYANMQDNYGLYLYVYNPQALNFNTGSRANKIQMAVAYDADGNPSNYEKFDLKLCSMSTESNYYRLFYKFKVVDHKSADNKTILQRVNTHERRYDISGFELIEHLSTKPEDYTVGGTFKFTGYAKGYGVDRNAESTLACDVQDLETLELNVHSTYYRPDGRNAEGGLYIRDTLNSVYFAVPDSMIEKYGEMSEVHAEWYEYLTKEILVVGAEEVYNHLINYMGYVIDGWDKDVYYGFSSNFFGQPTPPFASALSYNLSPNYVGSLDVITTLYYLFYTGGDPVYSHIVTSEEFKQYLIDYSAAKDSYDILDKYSSDLFYNYVDAGRKAGYNELRIKADDDYSLTSYVWNNASWLEQLFGKSPYDKVAYNDVKGIYAVTAGDFASGDRKTICDKLYIAESDYAEFKDFYMESTLKNETVYLLRFAVTDYSARYVYLYKGMDNDLLAEWPTHIWDDFMGYIAQQTVFLDFDIIDVTFYKDGVYTVIPVVASPIDIFNEIVPPKGTGGSGCGSIGNGCSGINWQLILMLLALALLLFIFWPFLPGLILLICKAIRAVLKGVVWIITAPFKGIKKLIDKKKG